MSKEPPIGNPIRAAFFISCTRKQLLLSASFGSAAVAKAVRRGSTPSSTTYAPVVQLAAQRPPEPTRGFEYCRGTSAHGHHGRTRSAVVVNSADPPAARTTPAAAECRFKADGTAG
jgi:hypothetical protein